jgi:hypothetical protein
LEQCQHGYLAVSLLLGTAGTRRLPCHQDKLQQDEYGEQRSAHPGERGTAADRSTRRDILEWNNQRSLEMEYEADSDEGQDHVLIWFD